MKLTMKGLMKIIGDIVVNSPECPLSETLDGWNRTRDFDQDDFKDTVVLTLEEAKLVTKALAFASCPSFANSDTYFAFFEEMKKRVEQAESLHNQRS